MYVTPLTGKALSNTNQKQFLENLEKRSRSGESLTGTERRALGQNKARGTLYN